MIIDVLRGIWPYYAGGAVMVVAVLLLVSVFLGTSYSDHQNWLQLKVDVISSLVFIVGCYIWLTTSVFILTLIEKSGLIE